MYEYKYQKYKNKYMNILKNHGGYNNIKNFNKLQIEYMENNKYENLKIHGGYYDEIIYFNKSLIKFMEDNIYIKLIHDFLNDNKFLINIYIPYKNNKINIYIPYNDKNNNLIYSFDIYEDKDDKSINILNDFKIKFLNISDFILNIDKQLNDKLNLEIENSTYLFKYLNLSDDDNKIIFKYIEDFLKEFKILNNNINVENNYIKNKFNETEPLYMNYKRVNKIYNKIEKIIENTIKELEILKPDDNSNFYYFLFCIKNYYHVKYILENMCIITSETDIC
jgi:hypothetical protein